MPVQVQPFTCSWHITCSSATIRWIILLQTKETQVLREMMGRIKEQSNQPGSVHILGADIFVIQRTTAVILGSREPLKQMIFAVEMVTRSLHRLCADLVADGTLQLVRDCVGIKPAARARVKRHTDCTCAGNLQRCSRRSRIHLGRQELRHQFGCRRL